MNNGIYETTIKTIAKDEKIELLMIMNLDLPNDLGFTSLGRGLSALFPEDKDDLSPLAKFLLTVVDEDLAEMKFKHVDFYQNNNQIIARTDSTKAIKYLIQNTRNTSIRSRLIMPIDAIDDFMIVDTSNIRKEWINDLGVKDMSKEYDEDTLRLSCVAARQINDVMEVDDIVWVLEQDTNQKIEAIVSILIDKLVTSGSKKLIDAIEKHLGSPMSDLARRFLANITPKVK